MTNENNRPNTPQSSEVDVDKLQDDLQQAISDTHDIDVNDEHYARNIVEHLKEKGYLKTPAEDVRCDGINAQLDGLIIEFENALNETNLWKLNKALTKLKAMRGE